MDLALWPHTVTCHVSCHSSRVPGPRAARGRPNAPGGARSRPIGSGEDLGDWESLGGWETLFPNVRFHFFLGGRILCEYVGRQFRFLVIPFEAEEVAAKCKS